MSEQYFIKSDYQARSEAPTYDVEARSYWNATRIQMAAVYQYYVYTRAAELFKARGFQSVLDVGSGPPTKLKQLIAPYAGDIVLIDQPSIAELAAEMLPEANFTAINLETIDIDLGRLFDMILCVDVIEHLMHPTKSMDFIRRHIDPNGLVILSTPERDYLRGKDCNHSPKYDHVREWNRAELAQYAISRGFKIVEHMFFPYPRLAALEYRLSRIVPQTVWQHLLPLSRRWFGCQMLVCKAR